MKEIFVARNELARGQVGLDPGRALRQRGGVHLVEEACGPLTLLPGAEPVDQPVRVQRVIDGVALAEELGVPHDLGSWLGLCNPVGDPLGGAHRDGRLADHDVAGLEERQDAVHGRPDVGEVRGVLPALLRRAHADEVHDRVAGLGGIGGELQPAGGQRVRQQLVEARLVERRPARRQRGDLLRDDVDAHHLVAERGHARGMDGAQVAAAEDGDPHSRSLGARYRTGPSGG
jgi:hypothetical protein